MNFCETTNFPLGSPEKAMIPESYELNETALKMALESFILSASGWRKVFAADENEESDTGDVSPENLILCGLAARTFADYVKAETGKDIPLITLGCDSRPTGAAIAEAMARVFIFLGCEVKYLFISAAPEIMASNRLDPAANGFAYISASHNPLGHNGMKFGLSDGGVVDGSRASVMISAFKKSAENISTVNQIIKVLSKPEDKLKQIFTQYPTEKKLAKKRYKDFTRWVSSDCEDEPGQARFFDLLSRELRKTPLGIVAELNGSARTLSIDEEFLTRLGFKVKVVNGAPRQITHRIVPEGASLDLCRSELEKAHAEDPAFLLGYVPDNDGDRGNLVYFDKSSGVAKILQAQEVFALTVLGELSFSVWMDRMGWSSEGKKPLAVAVNGPTSLRIEEIARPFGAEVFKAEVGEANVVNRAREARAEGFRVRILGEGSNGGNITHPAAVRDPMNTLFSMAKLLRLTGNSDQKGLFQLWCELSGQMNVYHDGFTLGDIMKTLPAWTSTSAYEPEAILPLGSGTLDHGALKSNFEKNFPARWDAKKKELKDRWGIVSWKETNAEGTKIREGVGKEFRSGLEKGGLKIELYDDQDEIIGYLWMRGSGTEPVFRVAVEIKGDDVAGEKELLSWLREMVEAAR